MTITDKVVRRSGGLFCPFCTLNTIYNPQTEQKLDQRYVNCGREELGSMTMIMRIGPPVNHRGLERALMPLTRDRKVDGNLIVLDVYELEHCTTA